MSSREIRWAGLLIDMDTNSYNEGAEHAGREEKLLGRWCGAWREAITRETVRDGRLSHLIHQLNIKYRSLKSQAHISTV